jgi:NADH-quinone oxidoreductase subunit N
LSLANLTLLLPELLLAATAFVVLGLDIIWRGEERPRFLLPALSLGGLGLMVVATWWLLLSNALPVAGVRPYGPLQPGGTLVFDPLAIFFKLFTALTLALVLLTSLDYLRTHTKDRGEFYTLLLLAGLAIALASASTNLVMIYLSIEFLSITSYILTGYLREDKRSTESAIKYFLYGAVTSAIMLYGLSLLYGATGSTDLAVIGATLAKGDITLRWLIFPATVLVLAGLGFKIALVPFHQWSPDAYEGAPTPVTAFLSVGPKAAGFAVLLRLLLVALPDFQNDWAAILIGLSIVTMTVGNLVALWQTNIKRMLAYSSIAQAGYMLIGVAALPTLSQLPQVQSGFTGINGLLLFLFAYLFTNLGAFAAVIAFENATGSVTIDDYAGLMRRAPWLAIALFIFLLSLIGIPPTAGFIGKFFVFAAAIQRNEPRFYILAVIGIANSVISVFYYYGVMRQMFLAPPPEGEGKPLQVSPALTFTIAFTTVMTFAIALYPQPFIDLATQSVQLLALR